MKNDDGEQRDEMEASSVFVIPPSVSSPFATSNIVVDADCAVLARIQLHHDQNGDM